MLEILAPCGSPESLDAALNAGADAVYLGLSSFSARRNAANFSFEELKAGVKKAHRQGVRVYAAINTLIFDDEFNELEKAVTQVSEAEADGVIVQDMGSAALIKEMAPELRLHASTQMTITSVKGAEFALKQGFSRVVLPRELSFKEIKEITSRVDIETEVFVHGALCVCVSGQCLLSAVIGGRSGNRGLCAQPCRLDYRCGSRSNVLSLKDLSLIEQLKELETAGVTSAKIEGRMKRPEYVAAAVGQCRSVLNGGRADTELLRSVFSRSGFTKSYFDGTFADMQGVRSREDTENTAAALAEIHQSYRQPCKRFTVDLHVEIKRNKPVVCGGRTGNIKAEVMGDVPQEALNRSLDRGDVILRMGKLGGTVFEAGKISCDIDEGLSLSASAINGLRRDIITKLEDSIEERIKKDDKRTDF